MAVIVFGERLTLDGVDISDSVLAWQLQQVGRDVPTVTLELRPNLAEPDAVLFEGYVNVRIASQGPDLREFLAAVDGEELTRLMPEGDMSELVGASALRVLRELANKVTPT